MIKKYCTLLLILLSISSGHTNDLSIWMGSMNIENQHFTGQVLAKLLRPSLLKFPGKENITKQYEVWQNAKLLPDVLVFACQECKPNKEFRFANSILGQKWLLGKIYKELDSNKTTGVTKIDQGISHIYVGVMVKRRKYKHFSKVKDYTSRRNSAKLKGAVFVQFKYKGIKYSFGSAHLDASSEKARNADIAMIHKTLSKNSPDVVALMGDFNYRITKDLSDKKKNSPDYLIEKLQAASNIHEGLKHRDSLFIQLSSNSLTGFKKWGFDIPEYTFSTLPTYKKSYKTDKDNSNCITLAFNKKIKRSWNGCYFRKGPPKEKSCLGTKCIDFGWLDRLATKGVFAKTLLAGKLSHGKKYLRLVKYGDAPLVTLGDHSAIWAQFESISK